MNMRGNIQRRRPRLSKEEIAAIRERRQQKREKQASRAIDVRATPIPYVEEIQCKDS